MGFFSKTMSEIAEFLSEVDDVIEFEENYDGIVANIDGSFSLLFCDESN